MAVRSLTVTSHDEQTSANTIRAAQTRGLPIFAETCPQYLNLTWEDLVSLPLLSI